MKARACGLNSRRTAIAKIEMMRDMCMVRERSFASIIKASMQTAKDSLYSPSNNKYNPNKLALCYNTKHAS